MKIERDLCTIKTGCVWRFYAVFYAEKEHTLHISNKSVVLCGNIDKRRHGNRLGQSIGWVKLSGIYDHPRSGYRISVVSVCMSVCMSVCLSDRRTITFESLDVESSYSHMQYISRDYGSSSDMKVIGSKSRS